MITVAVAGGTSPGLGRAMVRAIEETNELKPIVLTRPSSKIPEWLRDSKVEVRRVDYSSEESCFEALDGVNIIICTILAQDGTWAQTQNNLLNAGLRRGVSRFAPAEYGIGPEATKSMPMFGATFEVSDACLQATKTNPGFEFACFHVGLFMNYLGYGAPDEKNATHEMRDNWVFIWDVKNMKAALPISQHGDIPRITMTEIGDVGRFVAAACLLPKGSWKADMGIVGETLGLDEVVKIIEKVRGSKMEVIHRPVSQIEQEEAQATVFYPNQFWLQVELATARNQRGALIMSPDLNALCPSVKPLSVEQYMKKFWG